MTKLMPGVRREDLAPADDPGEGLRIASEAARLLRDAYGDRLRQVVLFGSWARRDAHEESDVDLLVVLDEVANRVHEGYRFVDVLYDLEADSKRAIEAFPVTEEEAAKQDRAFLRHAFQEGVLVFEGRA
jgi:predicted nucleotidyltransferase